MKKGEKPTKDEKPQRQRFIDTAKELGVDESKEAFERAFKKFVPVKATSKPRS